jgi:hypothetical protein
VTPGVVALVLIVIVGAAQAESSKTGSPKTEPPRPKSQGDGPCNADIERFCKSIPRGGGKIRTCLLSHASDLAPGCRARLQSAPVTATTGAAGVAIPERLVPCEADIRKHCPGVTAGGGRLRACLDLHVGKLEPSCAAVLKGRARGPKSSTPPR